MAAPFEDIRMILQAEAVYPLLIQTLDEGGAVPSVYLANSPYDFNLQTLSRCRYNSVPSMRTASNTSFFY